MWQRFKRWWRARKQPLQEWPPHMQPPMHHNCRCVVVVDDIDDPQNSMTPSQRAEILQWYEGLNKEKDSK